MLADLTESLIGALYLTFGFEAVRPAVVEAFAEHIVFAEKSYVDHKTELQEQLAATVTRSFIACSAFSGPPHDRQFEVEAVVEGEVLGHGVGASKKRAEQEAAAEVLRELAARERRQTRRVRLRGRRGGRGASKPSTRRTAARCGTATRRAAADEPRNRETDA